MRVKIGNKYVVKCGWGDTPSILLNITSYKHKTQYVWGALKYGFSCFEFVSYDLKGVKKYEY